MQLKAIIFNTFRETIRNRVLYNIFIFIFALLVLSLLIGTWSLGERIKIIKDFGLTAISLFGLLIAVFVGIRLMHQEIERKTIYILLAKPLQRWKIIVGKFFGLAITITINILLMTLAFVLVLLISGGFDSYLFLGILMTTFEILIIVALSILFSTFFSPLLSALFTIAFYFAGQVSTVLRSYFETDNASFTGWFFQVVYYIAPNLERFAFAGRLVRNQAIGFAEITAITAYSFFYIGAVLALAVIIFNRAQFEK